MVWTDDKSGFPVEPRRQLNGKWRIFLKEDILQAILHYYIGAELCLNAKEELRFWLDQSMVPECPIPEAELDRREFYLRSSGKLPSISLNHRINSNFWTNYFLSMLGENFMYDDDEPASSRNREEATFVDVKQQLLRHLASEVLLKSKIHGDFAVVQTDLQWYATAIPHSTIFAVLEFAGLPPKWLTWMRKYLEVPLTLDAAGGQPGVRTRLRGISMGHTLEKYLGEMVLVFLDLALRREAGILPYRMHDDIVRCGSTAECEKGWAAMQKFIRVMGLEFNKSKTGSVAIHSKGAGKDQKRLPDGDVTMAFLKLDTDGRWIIDTTQVDAHIKQLKKQLGECTDILSYIRTYNSCIGRFFSHTFGLPAQCFGPQHFDQIFETHAMIQAELFGDGGVSDALKFKLQDLVRNRTNLPQDFVITDAFIFNPILLGGLGVVNPFVSLSLVKNSVHTSPEKRIEDFLQEEREDYKTLKRAFDDEGLKSRKMRRTEIFLKNKSYEEEEINVSLNEFITFEEYVKDREWTSGKLSELYESLIKQATVEEINMSRRVVADLRRLNYPDEDDNKLTPDERYLIQLFSDRMFEQFGTVGIVDKSLAALGVMKAVMAAKVSWQMVLQVRCSILQYQAIWKSSTQPARLLQNSYGVGVVYIYQV